MLNNTLAVNSQFLDCNKEIIRINSDMNSVMRSPRVMARVFAVNGLSP